MPFVRKRMTPFAQYKLKLERPAWKLETARTTGRCERDGDACDPVAFSCFAAAFSRLRRMARNRAGLSARPMVTSQTLRVSLMPDLLALCADWLRQAYSLFSVTQVLHSDSARRRRAFCCAFPHAPYARATSASKCFAVSTLAARQRRQQIANNGATGRMTKARLRTVALSLVHYCSDLVGISPAPALHSRPHRSTAHPAHDGCRPPA